MSSIDLSGEVLFQSPYTYLQAAGSDGEDGTVKGFHLRWDFKKILQDNHLPKGDLSGPSGVYPATYGFNKEKDFVTIHRAIFSPNYYTEVNFNNIPTTIIEAGSKREWRYSDIVPFGLIVGLSKVIVSFPDISYYDSVRATIDPASNPLDFIKRYEREINVRLDGKLCFRVEWQLALVDARIRTRSFRYESIKQSDTTDPEDLVISCRKDVEDLSTLAPVVVVCEDIERVRFDRFNAYPEKMKLYGYNDYVTGVNQKSGWVKLDDFALTDSATKAYSRLELPALFTINNHWPKFNEVDFGTGAFTVKTANYQDRWSSADGIEFGVKQYLTLSQIASNYNAIDIIDSDALGGVADDSKMEVSYLNLLSMVSVDFHVARMLGLGHIDAQPEVRDTQFFVYLMEYTTLADLEDGGGARTVKHVYMTPELNSTDYKLPEIAQIESIDYGLELDNGTPESTQLTDDNGYAKFADIRFVNLNRESMNYEREMETFFETEDQFCICSQSAPVAFGLEYALSGQPYVKPELNHDSVYTDSAGIAETIIIPNNEQNPVYRHQETKNGIHCYALYSINWFSRASVSGADACTDYTSFQKRNTILPPANFAVQLIQPETPLILTTGQEQLDYQSIVGDKTYVRASFDWNYIHHQAYQFADKAQVYFNKEEKRIVQGKINTVTQLADHKIEVTTTFYNNLSVSPAQTVQPIILPTTESAFIGSLFGCDGQNYRVESIIVSGAGLNPKFILHQIKETHSMENPVGSNVWVTTQTFVSPTAGERFLVAENLGNASNWDNRLQKTIHLEKFGSNDFVSISGSSLNNGNYTVNLVNLAGGNTELITKETFYDSIVDGDINYDLTFISIGFNIGETGFLIAGDVTSEFSGITNLRIFGSILNDGSYTINTVSYSGGNTEVTVVETLDNTSWVGKILIQKQVAIAGYNTGTSTITISGDLTALIKPTRKESRINEDGSITRLTIGGFVENCEITEQLDVYNPDNVALGFSPGDDIAGSRTGIYELVFSGNPLPPHIDPDVKWFRGKVRIKEDPAFLPTPLGKSTSIMRELDVWNVSEDDFGNLVIAAYDPTFEVDAAYMPSGEYVPILTGTGVQINYHPSYLLYFSVDENTVDGTMNTFNQTSILPAFGDGSRKTFMGIRAYDTLNNVVSHVGTPAAVIADELREPLAPNPPDGPLYATRPDFYGKSTYTLDISFTNIPYSVLVYRANDRLILSTLYTSDRVEDILTELAALPQPDIYFTERWRDFVNVVTVDNPGNPDDLLFTTDGVTSFRFPIPNNPAYVIPQTVGTGSPINPFNDVNLPGSEVITFSVPGNPTLTMKQVVKDAIAGSFISQSEAPILFEHIKLGVQTSNEPPRLRDDNDILIAPSSGNPLYNPAPFAVKLPSGDLRYTDYKIDGGSDSFYFYYAMELSAKQMKSPPSDIVGPVKLVNTRPAKEPKIKKVYTIIKNDAEEIITSVQFKLEEYVTSEQINRIDIYRAINSIDAITVRTMDLAAEIDIVGTIGDTDILDVFEGLDFPLYGEDLHYRLVAMRAVTLEDNATIEYIPSEPSKLLKTSLVDPDNPPAPCLVSENGITTAAELQNVILKWEPTCYNGTYSLQKMNASGNWETFYSIKTNESLIQYPPLAGALPDFINYPETESLARTDEDDNPIYYRFRVQVENSSGLFNLNDCLLTLATGCLDLASLTEVVNFEDSNGFIMSDLSSQSIDDGSNNNPGSITFTANVPAILPAGHNSFDKLEISVKDDLGNTASATILTSTGSHTFMDGDGDTVADDLQLNDANRVYTITTTLYTDLCTTGYRRRVELAYVHGPCNDLSQLTDIVELTDSTHTYNLEESTIVVNDGVAVPVSLTFTDISNVAALTIPQTFDSLEITLLDGLGNSDVKTISTAGGSVVFNDGDNGLILDDSDFNRDYSVLAKLKTLECSDGITYEYFINYNFSPCVELSEVESVLSFTDNNSASINPLANDLINEGVNHSGGSLVLTDLLSANLPVGHILSSIDVAVYDGIGGLAIKPLPLSGSVTFNTGDGDPGSELELGALNPNATIIIEATAITDICSNGAVFSYSLNYTYSPYEDLATQTDVVNYSDANGLAKTPLDSTEFNDGINNNPGGTMTLTDIVSSNLPLGDTFDKIEVLIEDGLGNSFTKEITTIGGNVVFNHGEGGLVLNASDPNRTYTFSLNVKTTFCPDGVLFVYAGQYTFIS